MLYKALANFATVNAAVQKGQILTLTNEAIINDWLQAGYIEPYTAEDESEIDLSDYVKYDDYAQANHGGVITSGYGFNVNPANGKISVSTLSADDYAKQNNSYPISKGTLENVLATIVNGG